MVSKFHQYKLNVVFYLHMKHDWGKDSARKCITEHEKLVRDNYKNLITSRNTARYLASKKRDLK